MNKMNKEILYKKLIENISNEIKKSVKQFQLNEISDILIKNAANRAKELGYASQQERLEKSYLYKLIKEKQLILENDYKDFLSRYEIIYSSIINTNNLSSIINLKNYYSILIFKMKNTYDLFILLFNTDNYYYCGQILPPIYENNKNMLNEKYFKISNIKNSNKNIINIKQLYPAQIQWNKCNMEQINFIDLLICYNNYNKLIEDINENYNKNVSSFYGNSINFFKEKIKNLEKNVFNDIKENYYKLNYSDISSSAYDYINKHIKDIIKAIKNSENYILSRKCFELSYKGINIEIK